MASLGIETQGIPNGAKEQEDKAAEDVKRDGGVGGQTVPSLTRPPRNRKAVDRYPVEAVARRSSSKRIPIYPGRGTQLKDIPNVAFKISKRKTDNNLLLLHNILFGKTAKGPKVKRNIGLFSGFVWLENEEKERAKVKQKLDKCVKEKLMDFCNILDIPINKATVKKEDLAATLFEFLESPHATTETLLADKNKTKKHKQNSQVGEKQHPLNAEEDDEEAETSTGEDESKADSYEEELNDLEGDGDDEEEDSRKQTVADNSSLKRSVKDDTQLKGPSAKSLKISSQKRSSSSLSKKVTSEAESESKTSAKKQKLGKEHNKGQNASLTKKSSGMNACKSSAKAMTKGQGKTGKKKDKAAEVTGEELKAELAIILKDADLYTTTLSDILRHLGAHFHTDLSHRKEEIKAIITDVVNDMMDDEEDAKDTEAGNLPKDEDDNDTYYD